MNDTHANAELFVQLLDRVRRLPVHPVFKEFFELGLSPSHLRALFVLRGHPNIPMKELAEALGMTPPSVTALTRRLGELDFVERRQDPADSRRVMLALSPGGAAMLEAMHASHVIAYEQLLSGLSGAEQGQLLDLMRRAVESMERAVAREHPGHACP
ncbi:MAG TPA: MarR family transcriptional regulator [Herpetosiphonaceae bacterium]